LESAPQNDQDAIDSIYNFSEKISGLKKITVIDSASHQDFSCLSLVVPESGNCRDNGVYLKIEKLIIDFLKKPGK
jgi:hypothetical protein